MDIPLGKISLVHKVFVIYIRLIFSLFVAEYYPLFILEYNGILNSKSSKD